MFGVTFIYSDFIYVAIIGAAFAISCALTPLMRAFASRVGAIDKPDGSRKLQKTPVPYFGGMAIVLSFLAVSAAALLAIGNVPKNYVVIAVGTALMATLGMIDDLVDLKSYVKFGFQLVIASATVFFGGPIEYITFFGKYVSLGFFAVPLTILWIVLVVNAVNMIDGLDGLACGISSFSLMAMFTASLVNGDTVSAVICAALCGAALGFLPFNITPASIFMGDMGSMSLGYVMACISVFGFAKGTAFISVVIPALILAVPLTDAVRLFFERILKKRSPFSSDRLHIHHKLVDMGLTPRQAVLVLYVLSAAFSVAAVLYIKHKIAAAVIAGIAFLLMIVIRVMPKSVRIRKKSVETSSEYDDDSENERV